jgi:predicted dehydrogenase
VKRLKVAVVGFGVMGKNHAGVYAALPYTDLVAVVDPSAERRAEAAQRFAVATYPDVETMLTATHLDAVSVAAPTSHHYRVTRQLLEFGVPVLVEKPVAASVAEAEKLAALSRRLGVILQVGHITRFYQAVELLGERISAPYLIEARRLSPNARIQDVGVILDLMIHDIDIVLGIVASPVASVHVSGHVLGSTVHEDVAAAQITFENGCIARFLASRVAPDAERTLVVAEKTQTLRVDFGKEPHTEVSVYRPVAEGASHSEVRLDRMVVHEDNPLRRELEHFLARIRRGAPPIGTLDDDLRSLQLATQLIRELHSQLEPRPAVLV